MFEELTGKLELIFKKLRGQGRLNEKNIKDGLREVRRALLEADVNYLITKNFIKEIEKRVIGEEVMRSLTPAQQLIKIVNEQLIQLMKDDTQEIRIEPNKITSIMIVGLQGSGKTSVCAKLANYFKKNNNPLLVACDIYRPAAIKQLETLGNSLQIPVFTENTRNVVKIAKDSLKYANKNNNNLAIFDTAGRLHIDDRMMKEVEDLKSAIHPDWILFTADAMTGQDAVNVAKEFNSRLDFDGIVLTKLDGDARGGAALSMKAVTEKPIKFVSIGEKLNDLERFYADRMASRILGMGDVLTLVEKAEQALDRETAEKLERKLRKSRFTFNDFLTQLDQMRNMGPLDNLLKMIPGVQSKALRNIQVDEKDVKHIEAIVLSMTEDERENPDILNGTRRRRIAQGSGTSIQQVNRLIKQFNQMQKMVKQFSKGKFKFGRSMMPF